MILPMSIFVIFRVSDTSRLEEILAREFSDDHRIIANGQYLVASRGSAQQLSDRLQITGDAGNIGPAIVFKMLNYYGRAPADIWDWIKIKAEQSDG
jgi:hypothetical protein